MERTQFRLILSPNVEVTEDDLMDTCLQNTRTQLDRPNEQNLTKNPNPINHIQEESHSEHFVIYKNTIH